MQLPTYEIDHYELDNGEDINREYPDSFWIPDKESRETLQPGNIVKLIFRMEESKGSEKICVERMWVEVTHVHDEFYEGTLDNEPTGSGCVKCGQNVYFQPCHLIYISAPIEAKVKWDRVENLSIELYEVGNQFAEDEYSKKLIKDGPKHLITLKYNWDGKKYIKNGTEHGA